MKDSQEPVIAAYLEGLDQNLKASFPAPRRRRRTKAHHHYGATNSISDNDLGVGISHPPQYPPFQTVVGSRAALSASQQHSPTVPFSPPTACSPQQWQGDERKKSLQVARAQTVSYDCYRRRKHATTVAGHPIPPSPMHNRAARAPCTAVRTIMTTPRLAGTASARPLSTRPTHLRPERSAAAGGRRLLRKRRHTVDEKTFDNRTTTILAAPAAAVAADNMHQAGGLWSLCGQRKPLVAPATCTIDNTLRRTNENEAFLVCRGCENILSNNKGTNNNAPDHRAEVEVGGGVASLWGQETSRCPGYRGVEGQGGCGGDISPLRGDMFLTRHHRNAAGQRAPSWFCQ